MIVESAKAVARRLFGAKRAIRRALAHELAAGEPEIKLLPVLCRDDQDFLDVGANFGVYSYYAKSFCRHVYAMEPNPALSPHLQKILGRRGSVLAVAASSSAGVARFSIPVLDGHDVDSRSSLQADANPGFDLRAIDVRVAPIDEFGFHDIGVMKIDVEGHEFAALNGARRTLNECRPVAIVECEERHNPGGVARTFAFFSELDYQPYFIHRGRLRPGSDFQPAVLQDAAASKQVGGARSPDYINNFLFVPRNDSAALERIRQFTARGPA